MAVSQKCQYALRALFELAKRRDEGPVGVQAIAATQAIPARFLEVILQQLRQAGLVQSRRGTLGGYVLGVSPESLTVADIVETIDGSLAPVKCIGDGDRAERHCALLGGCAFMGLWKRAQNAVAEVYKNTTIRDLIDSEQFVTIGDSPDYTI